MITCNRCGNVMPNSALLCLACGALSVFSRPDINTPTNNESGSVPFPIPGKGQVEYGLHMDHPQPGYVPLPGNLLYKPSPMLYPSIPFHLTTTPIAPAAPSIKRETVLIEAMLNICLGLFGVGWLMAGETVTGLLLLAASIILYWPTLLIGFFLHHIFSIGPGLYGLIPLACGVTFLNVILLKRIITRKMVIF